MPGTFTQIYIHIVFAVYQREPLLRHPWRNDVFKYMAGIIDNKKAKSIIVNGVEDHVHLLLGFKPVTNLSDLIRDVKNNSSLFINRRNFAAKRFRWQEGYGAFSHSVSSINNVYQYILNQETHHQQKTFQIEYKQILERYNIAYDEKYLFD